MSRLFQNINLRFLFAVFAWQHIINAGMVQDKSLQLNGESLNADKDKCKE